MRIATSARNFAAVVLLLLAVLLGTGSLLGSTASALADTPEPLQRILGPLATDPALRQVLPGELGAALRERIPGGTALPEQLAAPLHNAVAAASGALLDEPGFPAAWGMTIETARADFMDRLAAAGEGEQVTLRLDLAPLLGSGYDTLKAALDGSVLGALLPGSLLPGSPAIPAAVLDTGWPAAAQLPTSTLNDWLAVARGWGWMFAAALVSAAAGLVLATRAGRPWAVFAGGALALALGGAARSWSATLGPRDTAAAPGVESLVTARLLEALAAELGTLSLILVSGGIVLMLGGAGWAMGRVRGARARARG